jgi:ATP-binding cassette subfamily A (ABC1) protein 3
VFGGVLVLLILFGPAAASFTYCVSFLFSSPSICNLVVIIFGFIVGLAGTLASFILLLLGSDPANPNPTLLTVADIIGWVLRFFPPYCLSKGLFSAINIETYEFLAGEPITVWHDSVLLIEVIFLAWQSVVYLLLAMKIDEWSSNPRIRNMFSFGSARNQVNPATQVADDDDVIAEQNRVLTGGANDDLIVLSQLTKVYSNGKVAVNNMSLGIPPGQCFGLLGINGAGKLQIHVVAHYSRTQLTNEIDCRQDEYHGDADS